jgi:hypothetical protein
VISSSFDAGSDLNEGLFFERGRDALRDATRRAQNSILSARGRRFPRPRPGSTHLAPAAHQGPPSHRTANRIDAFVPPP